MCPQAEKEGFRRAWRRCVAEAAAERAAFGNSQGSGLLGRGRGLERGAGPPQRRVTVLRQDGQGLLRRRSRGGRGARFS